MSEPTEQDLDQEQSLNYEQAREELVAVVQKLEAGAPLEESLALWERGERLASICQERLDGAKERVAAARRTTEETSAD